MAQALQHTEIGHSTGHDTRHRTGLSTPGSTVTAPHSAASNEAMRQMGLYEAVGLPVPSVDRPRSSQQPRLCAGCRAKEARYGFRPEGADDPMLDRPRTLCFECFRVEVTRRQLIRERMARGWNARQVGLPLEETLRALDKRRRRAQIAARHALGA